MTSSKTCVIWQGLARRAYITPLLTARAGGMICSARGCSATDERRSNPEKYKTKSRMIVNAVILQFRRLETVELASEAFRWSADHFSLHVMPSAHLVSAYPKSQSRLCNPLNERLTTTPRPPTSQTSFPSCVRTAHCPVSIPTMLLTSM